MRDVLVIKCNVNASVVALKKLRDIFIAQKEQGVVVIPPYCDVITCPDDVEIKVEGKYGE